MALFCEVSYGAEYLNSVEFTEKNVNDAVMWSGKEWITDTYPPKISEDGVQFTAVEGNEEIPEILKFGGSYKYVWTGSDYLVYKGHHSYLDGDSKKYMYRISEDFKTILNTYQIPNLINNIEFMDDKIFISTRNIRPKKYGDSVIGAFSCEYAVYYSTDCIEWTKLDVDKSNGDFLCMNKVDGKLLINNYIYSNEELNKIVYENSSEIYQYKIGQFVCRVEVENKNEDTEVLVFSNDGVYWDYLTIEKMNSIQNISEVGNEILIEDYSKFYSCNKEEIFSQLREKLDPNPVYVKLNGNILGFDTPPVIEDERTLIHIRFLFEQMGATVDWNGDTQTATISQDNTAVTFSIDDTEADVNGRTVTMDVPARLINGKTMVPLRFLSEELGYNVEWDTDTRIITIE